MKLKAAFIEAQRLILRYFPHFGNFCIGVCCICENHLKKYALHFLVGDADHNADAEAPSRVVELEEQR